MIERVIISAIINGGVKLLNYGDKSLPDFDSEKQAPKSLITGIFQSGKAT